MARNKYKDNVDRWTTNGLGIQVSPLTEEHKKRVEAVKKELAEQEAARKKAQSKKKK